MTISEIAQRYVAAGLSVIPIRPDRSKAPDLPEWKTYQHRVPTPDEYGHYDHADGIAVVAGAVSGNLEVIDFDDATTFTPWADLVESQLGHEFFTALVIVKTPRPGFHVYVRCDVIGGNDKLARVLIPGVPRPTIKALIETRGEGGYVLAPGCPGTCHETGRTYQSVQGKFSAIPRITVEQRDVLISAARSFNQYWRESEEKHTPVTTTGTLGGDYCQRASWQEILGPHGFRAAGQRGEAQLWTRPGKNHGVSASTNHAGSNLFYAFSTNCYPFDSERGYNKFGVFSLLNHNGDFSAAAKALAALGYGTQAQTEKQATPPDLKVEIVLPSSLVERVRSLYVNGIERGFDPGWPTVREHWTVRRGEWTLITGTPSHGKSSFVDALMVNLSRSQHWKWAVWSAENLPQEMHVVNLLEQYIGKPFHRGMHGRMTEAEINLGMEFIEEHVRFLAPPDEEETIARLLALTESDMPDGLVIDPWNELSHEYGRGTETDYISKQLKLLGRFVKKHKMHAVVVAHPAKPKKENIEGKMRYPVPGPYDVSGSSHFRNKADCCLCMWRDEAEPGTAKLYIQKIRRRFVGRIGSVDLRYDVATGRFADPNADRDVLQTLKREPGEDDQ